jgi:NAD(P)-dependent dehydrogenase (short-subunit alcohol dehydrogenase family)
MQTKDFRGSLRGDGMACVEYDFDDETVIVTGGSSGIGRAIAMAFGRAGAAVIVADIREAPRVPDSVPTHEAIIDRGGTAEYAATDVSDGDDIESVIEAAHRFGGVDVMVNNAAIAERRDILDVTPETLDRLHGVNVHGVLLGCTLAAQDMIERDAPGVILNTSSVNSEFISPNHIEYDATKGAVKMITRTAAYQLAEHGIQVNAVAPGLIPTHLSESGPEAAKAALEQDEFPKEIALDRPGEPSEIASGALFLCSDAASYITGEQLHIDGGYQIV